MTDILKFEGFTPQTIQFFKDLKENNYKDWFEKNRSVYENELIKPFKALINEISPVMYNIDPAFELRPHRILSRIYRDTRFSKNKEPYKTCLWMSYLLPTKEWENIPGYFMELNADTYFYGMGLFAPKKKTMDAYRDNIAYDQYNFEKQTKKLIESGFSIAGEEYKRPLKNDLPTYFQPWIQRKAIYLYKKKKIDNEVFSSELADIIRTDYEALSWLYIFMKDNF